MAEAVLGGLGVGLLLFTVGMSIWYATFLGSDTLADRWDGLVAPTGFLSFLAFVPDLAVAVGGSIVDIILFETPDLPSYIQGGLRSLYGMTFGVGLLLVVISVL